MSVCSGRGIVTDSTSSSAEANRQSSTRVACSEKIAKLTPTPSQVAPSGYGVPGQTRKLLFGTDVFGNRRRLWLTNLKSRPQLGTTFGEDLAMSLDCYRHGPAFAHA